MVMSKETKIGLTFGQIISVISILGGILISWIAINVRIAQAELRIDQLEKGRETNAQNIEKIRTENREDHQRIMDKLDIMQHENGGK